MDDKSPEKGGEEFDREMKEFTSEQLEVEYLHDVDDVGSENMRQKMKAELGRSRSLNHADKENKKKHFSKRGLYRSVILTFQQIKEGTTVSTLPLCHHNRCHHVAS